MLLEELTTYEANEFRSQGAALVGTALCRDVAEARDWAVRLVRTHTGLIVPPAVMEREINLPRWALEVMR